MYIYSRISILERMFVVAKLEAEWKEMIEQGVL